MARPGLVSAPMGVIPGAGGSSVNATDAEANWQIGGALQVGNAATGGIWRVLGAAGSAVLKVARLPASPDPAKSFPTGDDPTHWNYWRRESLAYETHLAAMPALA